MKSPPRHKIKIRDMRVDLILIGRKIYWANLKIHEGGLMTKIKAKDVTRLKLTAIEVNDE